MGWGELKLRKVPWGDLRVQRAHGCASARSDRRALAHRSKRSAGRESVQVIIRGDAYMAFCTYVYQQIPSGNLARSKTVEAPLAFKLPRYGVRGPEGDFRGIMGCTSTSRLN